MLSKWSKAIQIIGATVIILIPKLTAMITFSEKKELQ
jgi:hypothetical protein